MSKVMEQAKAHFHQELDRAEEQVLDSWKAHVEQHQLKGGRGSGHYGHSGRPGKVGGSTPGSGTIPKLPRSKFSGTVGEVQARAKERAYIMALRHPGVRFSLYVGNPLGIKEGRKVGVPGIGLPQAVYNKDVVPVSDVETIKSVVVAADKWGLSVTGYVTYTAIKEATGLDYDTVFGVVKYLKEQNPYQVNMTINRLSDNIAVKIKTELRDRYKEFIVEKQLPIDQASKNALLTARRQMFWDFSDSLSEQLYTGEISIGQWQEAFKQELRQLYTSSAAIGKGGWDMMEPADWGRLGPVMKDQYRYLQGFAEHISTNRDTISLKQIKARARMYGEGAAGGAVLVQAGVVFEALLPWLPRDGSTKCLNRCHCQWRNTIVGKDKKFNIVHSVWQLGQADHCETCAGRENHTEVIRVYETFFVPEVIGGY